jgi:hypothetical protein
MSMVTRVATHRGCCRSHYKRTSASLLHEREQYFSEAEEAKGCNTPAQFKLLERSIGKATIANLGAKIKNCDSYGSDIVLNRANKLLNTSFFGSVQYKTCRCSAITFNVIN